jgi:hypothetical protein
MTASSSRWRAASKALRAMAFSAADNVIQMLNATGGVVARNTQGQNIDEPLAVQQSATTDYYQVDGFGSMFFPLDVDLTLLKRFSPGQLRR